MLEYKSDKSYYSAEQWHRLDQPFWLIVILRTEDTHKIMFESSLDYHLKCSRYSLVDSVWQGGSTLGLFSVKELDFSREKIFSFSVVPDD